MADMKATKKASKKAARKAAGLEEIVLPCRGCAPEVATAPEPVIPVAPGAPVIPVAPGAPVFGS